MTAIESTSELRSKLNRLLVAKKRAQEISSLRPIALGLEGVVRKLILIKDTGELLNGTEISVAIEDSELARLTKLFEKAQGLADTDAFSLTKGKTYDLICNGAEGLHQGFMSQALVAWRTYLIGNDSTLDVVLVETLGKLRVDAANIKKYRDLKNRLTALSRELPDSRSTIEAAKKVVHDLHETASSLSLDQLDAAVKTFLQSVQTIEGADVTMLTPVVEKWCKENRIWHRLRIRVA